MWSKFANVLKSKTHEELSGENQHAPENGVMSKVLDQHPNLSMFHEHKQPPNENIRPSSPPPMPLLLGSLSKNGGKRSMFKRAPKAPTSDSDSSAPILPKKNKANLQLKTHGSQLSLAVRGSGSMHSPREIPRRASFDLLRNPATPPATVPSFDILQDVLRPSHSPSQSADTSNQSEEMKRDSPQTPYDARYGSTRSIMRDPNTPGTGQNVRFFSRDAYKVISPNDSMEPEHQDLTQPDEETFLRGLQRGFAQHEHSSTPRRPTVAEVFSPLSDDSHSLIPAPDFTNIFDVSQNDDLPSIPLGISLQDNAVEVTETESDQPATTSTLYKAKTQSPLQLTVQESVDETIFHSMGKSPQLPAGLHNKSLSVNLGQTGFFSMGSDTSGSKETGSPVSLSSLSSKYKTNTQSSTSVPLTQFTKSRSRALSDSFQTLLRTASASSTPSTLGAEADINDESSEDLVVYSSASPNTSNVAPAVIQPDPFHTDATTYYTPQTLIPMTPPRGTIIHARKHSKEDDLILSLQTQLALQNELCGQYSTDLRTRDELVELLTQQLKRAEAEDVTRRGILKGWKKKVAALERACRHLEEEVDNSRHESMERSVMDEASGEAMRMLHRQISNLQRENSELQRNDSQLRDEVATLEGIVKDKTDDVQRLNEALGKRDESERELKKGIREAKEQMEQMGNASVVLDEEDIRRMQAEEEKERHRVAESVWRDDIAALKTAKEVVEATLEETRTLLKTRDEEFKVLKTELEAQWLNTERGTEKILALESEAKLLVADRDSLKAEVEALEQRIQSLELEWTRSENRKNELEAELDDMSKHLDEVNEQLATEHDHASNDAQTIDALQDEIAQLNERLVSEQRAAELQASRMSTTELELKSAVDKVARLEETIRYNEVSALDLHQRAKDNEIKAEELQEQIINIQRDHGRESRAHDGLREEMDTVSQRTEVLQRDIAALKDERDRLARHIQELQQESADKEVKILQLSKQRAQDKEDMNGLNIALDSKQQELELMKRRQNVRGTAGSTPHVSKVASASNHRRDSSLFSTPGMPRSSSVISDVSAKDSISTSSRRSAESAITPIVKPGSRTGSAAKSSVSNSATKTVPGSMGPPPSNKPRMSVVGTPTPMARVSSASTFAPRTSMGAKTTLSSSASAPTRRVSGTLAQAHAKVTGKPVSRPNVMPNVPATSPTMSVAEEKENESLDPSDSDRSAKRRSLIPTPLPAH